MTLVNVRGASHHKLYIRWYRMLERDHPKTFGGLWEWCFLRNILYQLLLDVSVDKKSWLARLLGLFESQMFTLKQLPNLRYIYRFIISFWTVSLQISTLTKVQSDIYLGLAPVLRMEGVFLCLIFLFHTMNIICHGMTLQILKKGRNKRDRSWPFSNCFSLA